MKIELINIDIVREPKQGKGSDYDRTRTFSG